MKNQKSKRRTFRRLQALHWQLLDNSLLLLVFATVVAVIVAARFVLAAAESFFQQRRQRVEAVVQVIKDHLHGMCQQDQLSTKLHLLIFFVRARTSGVNSLARARASGINHVADNRRRALDKLIQQLIRDDLRD